MSSKCEAFIDALKDSACILAKEELKNLINRSKSDPDAFIRQQGKKLELYIDQLADGSITKKQFEDCILDVRDLTKMQSLKMTAEAKARAQYVVTCITNLIMNGLLKVV